jgi:glycosyltransferase involved in cell wall biosynthesis
MASLYSACTVFVYPSLYEGFGLTPLEAMACGAPVICSNTSSLPEVVGDAAIPIDPLDVNSIASAMSRVMHDGTLRAQLRACSLSQATRFTWARAAQQTVELYQAVTQKKVAIRETF